MNLTIFITDQMTKLGPPTKQPLVTIGMPLFNEEQFLQSALLSMLEQNYENIEIIISDNCSTDKTVEICKNFTQQYSHLSIYQTDRNIGSLANFIRVLEMAQGQYFLWAAGHDLWSKNYISECVNALEAHDNATIAFGTPSWINANGLPFNRQPSWFDTRSMSSVERFYTVFWGSMNPILGVIRRESLLKTPIINTVGSDLIMLSNLALLGEFIHVPECSWCRREFRLEATHSDKINRYKTAEQGFSKSIAARLFPLLRLPFELIKLVVRCEVPGTDKVIILISLIPSLLSRYLVGKRKKYTW